MFLEKYLTEFDDSLSGESYIDPLGMLVIWSTFGQKIFKNRVNSISNDVRNYTLNLFHHYLIRRLIRDDSVELSKQLINVYGGKDQLNFKYACILYLESLFVYSILKHEGMQEVDSGGVLGITKARRNWSEFEGNPILYFTHGKESQILVRQLGLGVSGRYKTPLMEIGFFDGNYHYQLPASIDLWDATEKFIKATPILNRLADVVFAHLKEVLQVKSSKPPQFNFDSIPKFISKNYVAAFSSPGSVGLYGRDFWLKTTGLDQGAAGALLQVLDANAGLANPQNLSSKQLLYAAMEIDLPDVEKLKMQHIETLEPFLAEVSLLFTLMTAKKSQTLIDIAVEWRRFGKNENTIPNSGIVVLNNSGLVQVLGGTALGRLNKLLKLVECKTLQEQIELLIAYHSDVMKQRGQSSWLSLDLAGAQIKTYVRPSLVPEVEEWKMKPWVNNYYLPQFKSLVFGYQGGGI